MSILSKGIVSLSYTLQTSSYYQKTKHFFYSVLEDDSYPYKKFFDYFMMALILSSVMLLIRGVKYPLSDITHIYNDYVISIIFLIEYLLRFWVYSSVTKEIVNQFEKDEFLGYRFRLFKALRKALTYKLKYVSSVYAIIDLLAIMPFFHQLRILRLFILFRALKIFRYTKSFQQFAHVFVTKKFEFITLIIFTSVIVSVSAVLIYVAESNNENSPINTLFESFYWSFVTLSTVGYGDFVPVTDLGRTVAMLIIISGIAIISFMTSIVVSAFTEQLEGIKEQKMITDISKMKRFYVVCGYSDIAAIVCKRFREDDISFVVLESNPDLFAKAVKAKLIAVLAEPSKRESYDSYGIDIKKQVLSVLCLQDTDVQNIYTALTVRSIHKDVEILSYLHDAKNKKKLSFAGVNKIIYPQELIGTLSQEFSGKHVAFEAINALRSQNTDVVIEQVLVDERIVTLHSCVEDLNIHKTKLILLGIYRNKNFIFNPQSDMEIKECDLLLIIGFKDMIKEYSLNLHKAMR